MSTDRRRELLRLAKKELKEGQHRLGCAMWYVRGRTIPPEGLRNQAAIEIIKAVKHLSAAGEIYLDEHKEFCE
jgi:hypothetical protein